MFSADSAIALTCFEALCGSANKVLRKSANVRLSFTMQVAALHGLAAFYRQNKMYPVRSGLPAAAASAIHALYRDKNSNLFTGESNAYGSDGKYITYVDDARDNKVEFLLPDIEAVSYDTSTNLVAAPSLKGTGQMKTIQSSVGLPQEMADQVRNVGVLIDILKSGSAAVIDLSPCDGIVQFIRTFGGLCVGMDKQIYKDLCGAVPTLNQNVDINGQNPSVSPLYQPTIVAPNTSGALATMLDMVKAARNRRMTTKNLMFFMDTFGYKQLRKSLTPGSAHAEIKDLNESNMSIRMHLFSPSAVRVVSVGGIPVVHWANNSNEKRIFLCSPQDLGITFRRTNGLIISGGYGDGSFIQNSSTHSCVDLRVQGSSYCLPRWHVDRSIVTLLA